MNLAHGNYKTHCEHCPEHGRECGKESGLSEKFPGLFFPNSGTTKAKKQDVFSGLFLTSKGQERLVAIHAKKIGESDELPERKGGVFANCFVNEDKLAQHLLGGIA